MRPNLPAWALDPRILQERLLKESRIVAAQPSKEDIEARATVDGLACTRQARDLLRNHSSGYRWKVERHEGCASSSAGRGGVSALACLAQGISTAEVDFMPPIKSAPRYRVTATLAPTMPPTRFDYFDPSQLTDEQYRLFLAHCQPLRPPPPLPEPRPAPAHIPANLAGDHYLGTQHAQQWVRGERALSQWDTAARAQRVAEMQREARARAKQEAHDACKRLIKWEERRTRKNIPPKQPVEGSRPANALRVPR
jgi:hypothetical protein